MRGCGLFAFLLVVLGCSDSEKNNPGFQITEVLYEENDVARAVYQPGTDEYVLTLYRSQQDELIMDGPFIYKVLDSDFEEIRTGQVGSDRFFGGQAGYTPVVALSDTVLFGDYHLLEDNTLMAVSRNYVWLYDDNFEIIDQFRLPYEFDTFTETDELVAFIFDFSYEVFSENDTICVTYNKNTKEFRKYLYKFDSDLDEPYANRAGAFSITHNADQELIMATTKGVHKLDAGEWVSYLNQHLYGRGLVTTLHVDSRNRLFAIFADQAEVYDLATENLITSFPAPYGFVTEDRDGDYVFFQHPSYTRPTNPKIYKFRVY